MSKSMNSLALSVSAANIALSPEQATALIAQRQAIDVGIAEVEEAVSQVISILTDRVRTLGGELKTTNDELASATQSLNSRLREEAQASALLHAEPLISALRFMSMDPTQNPVGGITRNDAGRYIITYTIDYKPEVQSSRPRRIAPDYTISCVTMFSPSEAARELRERTESLTSKSREITAKIDKLQAEKGRVMMESQQACDRIRRAIVIGKSTESTGRVDEYVKNMLSTIDTVA